MIRKEDESVSIKYKLYLLLYERIEERLSIGQKKSKNAIEKNSCSSVQGTKLMSMIVFISLKK